MREIKFRAWDGKTMYYQSDRIWFYFEGNFWSVNRGRIPGECLTLSADANAKLMQYTGLKDKNGKEIYEGDIIKYTRKNWYCIGHLQHKKDLIKICTAYWDDEKHAFGSDSKFSSGYLIFNDQRADENIIEIIGNIYENPELLDC